MRISETFKSLPAIKARAQIPAHKRKSQWLRTLAGGAVFIGGLCAPTYLHFPWQAGLGIAAFGAFISSQQLVLDFAKAIPQAIAAIAQAMSGKSTP